MPQIRIRVALAVVHQGRILLVLHYDTDAGPVQWTIPGGRLTSGEGLRDAAAREFREEDGWFGLPSADRGGPGVGNGGAVLSLCSPGTE